MSRPLSALAGVVAVSLLLVACGSAPVPTIESARTASATPDATAVPTASPSPTFGHGKTTAPTLAASGSVTIELASVDSSSISGRLTAHDNGNGTTTLAAELPNATALYPWSLHPSFDCQGAPAEDSQLAVGLPDIENGASSEIIESANFTTSLGVVVFALGVETATPVACGVLPPLDWAASGPPTTAPTVDPGVPTAIADLVDDMEAAVLAGDDDAYMALVDLTDPVFTLEHTRWAADWAGPNRVDEFDLTITGVSVAGTSATGQLAISWASGTQGTRTASFPVHFVVVDGEWRYAGERWVVEELERFRVQVTPGLESEVAAIADDLPAIYEHVTDSLDYVPDARMEIKVYPDGPALVATTLLSLPDIHGWNEPGEALKVRLDPLVPSLTPAIAHEFTHFAIFDRAGTQRSLMPWWLDEGIATYVAEPYGAPGRGDERLETVRGWAQDGTLADWADMAVFETTPEELWPFVYTQGYAMVRFVTETYGTDQRNAWLAAMATESEIGPATQQVLGLTFPRLISRFEAWLLP